MYVILRMCVLPVMYLFTMIKEHTLCVYYYSATGALIMHKASHSGSGYSTLWDFPLSHLITIKII